MAATRSRADRCPGALRPWAAADGLLVRLRLVGGAVSGRSLRALSAVAEAYGDGRVHVTSRANLQVRALPATRDGHLPADVLGQLKGTGLLPTLTHELVRNIVVSPQSGVAGGRADLRRIAARLDELLCADPGLAALPGRFLFVLDDGRGDVVDRETDLGLVVLDGAMAQLRVGRGWGPVVGLQQAPTRLTDLARLFVRGRGDSPSSPWHVHELDAPFLAAEPADVRIPAPAGPLPFGEVAGGIHVPVSEAGLDRCAIEQLTRTGGSLVVTPWKGIYVTEETAA